MHFLPTIIIVSILGFFIVLTLVCIVLHWRRSKPEYVRRHSFASYRRSPVRRLTIQGGKVVDVSSALEKAGMDDDDFVEIPYPILKAFVDPDDEDLPSPPPAKPRAAGAQIRSNRAKIEAHPSFPQPPTSSQSPKFSDDGLRFSGVSIRDVQSIAIPPSMLTNRTGSTNIPRPSLINIEKKASSYSKKADKDRRETYPNERRSRPRSGRNRGGERVRDQPEKSDRASGAEDKGRQRSSAPEPRTRRSGTSSRRDSQAIQLPPPLPLEIIPTAYSQQRPTSIRTNPRSRPLSTDRPLPPNPPPEPTPRSSSHSAKRPPPLNLTPRTASPSAQPRFSLIPSTRTSTLSAKRPPPLDLKPKINSPSPHGPSPLGPSSTSSPPPRLPEPLPEPSPVSPESTIRPASPPRRPLSSPKPPAPLSIAVSKPPKSPVSVLPPPQPLAPSSRTSTQSIRRPPPLKLGSDVGSAHVRFIGAKDGIRRSLATNDSPATLTPSTIGSPSPIVRAPPPSMLDEPLYRTPPPPTPGELEAELVPEMVARLDRPPSLDVEIPHTGGTFSSFFGSSHSGSNSDRPASGGGEIRRGPSVLSNRSGITIASSEISSNWTIGNAQLVNIYSGVGDPTSTNITNTAPTSAPRTTTAIASMTDPVAGSSLSPAHSDERHTPPYAKTLRSKYGRYPRGRRDKALPTLPKSPLSMSFGIDDEIDSRVTGNESGTKPEGRKEG